MEHRDVSRRTLLKGGGAALAGLSCRWPTRPAPFSATTIESNTRGMTTSLTRRNPWDSPATWSSRGSTSPRRFPPRISAEPSSSGRSSTPGSPLPRSSISSRTTAYRLALTTLQRGAWRCRPGCQASLVIVAGRTAGRPRREIDFTFECSGNHGTGLPVVTGFIGNARWAGTPLAPVLEEARSPQGGRRDRVLRDRSRNPGRSATTRGS